MKFIKNIYTVLFLTIIFIGFSVFFNYIQLKNTIVLNKNNYIQIINDCHENIDKYVGKKIIISGYVYIQEDFTPGRFVIAQNICLNPATPDEAYIVGFLCENLSNYNFSSNETIRLKGKIIKGTYNNLEYPIIQFKNFDFVPYSANN